MPARDASPQGHSSSRARGTEAFCRTPQHQARSPQNATFCLARWDPRRRPAFHTSPLSTSGLPLQTLPLSKDSHRPAVPVKTWQKFITRTLDPLCTGAAPLATQSSQLLQRELCTNCSAAPDQAGPREKELCGFSRWDHAFYSERASPAESSGLDLPMEEKRRAFGRGERSAAEEIQTGGMGKAEQNCTPKPPLGRDHALNWNPDTSHRLTNCPRGRHLLNDSAVLFSAVNPLLRAIP